jgi:hypothetical protein
MDDEHKIEIMPESVEYGDQKVEYKKPEVTQESRERLGSALVALGLSLVFPIVLLILWITQGDPSPGLFQDRVVSVLLLYLVLIFTVPIASIISIIMALLVVSRSTGRARKIAYAALGVTGVGLILLGFFVSR